jgi:hypothetical protein
MDFGDDYVAARIAVDVPTESLSNVRELTEGIERFHTSMEAAIRSEADMSRYLEQMADSSKRAAEAQANVNQQLQTYIQLQGRSVGSTTSSGVPMGAAINPFGGMSAGMGMERPPASSDVYWQLNNHAQNAPREYMNMQAARGGVPSTVSLDPGSVASLAAAIADREKATHTQHQKTAPSGPAGSGPGRSHAAAAPNVFDQAQHRVAAGTGLANSVMNELGAAGGVGFGGLALQGMNFARKKLDAKVASAGSKSGTDGEGGGDSSDPAGGTGGLSGMAKGLGIAGGAVGALMGIFDLAQKAGSFEQGLRNTAGQRGGAAGEGLALQFNTRKLAMDPNVSTDQARQVYQALLSEGLADASGNGADGAKDFLTNNIKNFNMDVSQSVELLRLSAKGTKISLGSLTDTLSELREASKTGFLSQADLQQNMMVRAQQLISQGVDPAKALASATNTAYAFKILAGSLSSVDMNNPQGNAYLRMMGGPGGTPLGVPPGLDPRAVNEWLQNTGKGDEPELNVLQGLAKKAQQMRGDYQSGGDDTNTQWINATFLFNDLIKSSGFGNSKYANMQASNELYNKLIWEHVTPQDIVKQEKQAHVDATAGQRQTTETTLNTGQKVYGSQALGHIVSAYGGGAKGFGQIEVLDEKGKAQNFDPTNKDQVDKLDNGTYRWRHKGDKGKGLLLSDTPEDIGSGFSTDHPSNLGKGKDGAASVSGESGYGRTTAQGGGQQEAVKVALTDDAKKLLKLLDSNNQPYESPNDTAANSGQNGAAKNNPPPGDHGFRGGWVPR